MKKDQNLPNKKIHSKNSSGKPLPGNSNYSKNQSPLTPLIEVDRPNKEVHEISHKIDTVDQIVKNQIRNNYLRSNSNTTEFVSASSSHSNPRNRHYSNKRSRNSSYNRNRNYSNKGIEVTPTIEIRTIQTTDQEIIQIIDQIIKVK